MFFAPSKNIDVHANKRRFNTADSKADLVKKSMSGMPLKTLHSRKHDKQLASTFAVEPLTVSLALHGGILGRAIIND